MRAVSTKGKCKDCGGGVRPAPHPGPRCVTHWRAEKKRRKFDAWAKRILAVYNITPEQYQAIYESQGGKCYMCQRATGASKMLAIEHDHACCPGPYSCGKCIRCLACGKCNEMLGHARDDTAVFKRAIEVLLKHPAQKVLNGYKEA